MSKTLYLEFMTTEGYPYTLKINNSREELLDFSVNQIMAGVIASNCIHVNNSLVNEKVDAYSYEEAETIII